MEGSSFASRRLDDVYDSDLDDSDPVVIARANGIEEVRMAIRLWDEVMKREHHHEPIPRLFVDAMRTYADVEVWANLRKPAMETVVNVFIEVSEGVMVRLSWADPHGLQYIQISIDRDMNVAIEWDGDPVAEANLFERLEADQRFSVEID